jgi:hypothetical protein
MARDWRDVAFLFFFGLDPRFKPNPDTCFTGEHELPLLKEGAKVQKEQEYFLW